MCKFCTFFCVVNVCLPETISASTVKFSPVLFTFDQSYVRYLNPHQLEAWETWHGHLVHYITWLSYIYQYKHEPVFYCYRKLLGLTVNIVFRPPPKSSAPLRLRPSLVGPLTIKNSWPSFLTVLRFLFLNYYQHSVVHSAWLQERAMFYNVYTVIIKICRSLIQAETQNNDDQPVASCM
jgi:hypothetical protein